MTEYEYKTLDWKLKQLKGGARQVLGYYGDRHTADPINRDSAIWAECQMQIANEIQKTLDKLYKEAK